MTSERETHPGRRRQAPPTGVPPYARNLLDDLIQDWKDNMETSFLHQFFARKNPTCTDISKYIATFFYDMESRRRLLENQPIDFLREYCKYKDLSADYFLFNARLLGMDAINKLIQVENDFVVPIFMNTLTGDITFLRSKGKSSKKKVDYLFLNISEHYATIFDMEINNEASVEIVFPISRSTSLDASSFRQSGCGEQLFDTGEPLMSATIGEINCTKNKDAIPIQFHPFFKEKSKPSLDERTANASRKANSRPT